MVTDNARQLMLSDVAGLPVGHVPRELAPSFQVVLDNGGTVHAEPCGDPVPSTYPWPEQHEVGGGVVLPCDYIIKPVQLFYDETLEELRDTVSQMEARISMKIVI